MGRAKVQIRHVNAGVREVLKSDGVAQMLGAQAQKAAARCNAMCDKGLYRAGARYDAGIVQRRYTAGGLVYVSGAKSGRLAGIDNARNNTLKKGCGI